MRKISLGKNSNIITFVSSLLRVRYNELVDMINEVLIYLVFPAAGHSMNGLYINSRWSVNKVCWNSRIKLNGIWLVGSNVAVCSLFHSLLCFCLVIKTRNIKKKRGQDISLSIGRALWKEQTILTSTIDIWIEQRVTTVNEWRRTFFIQ